jgi:hypothetical protein
VLNVYLKLDFYIDEFNIWSIQDNGSVNLGIMYMYVYMCMYVLVENSLLLCHNYPILQKCITVSRWQVKLTRYSHITDSAMKQQTWKKGT